MDTNTPINTPAFDDTRLSEQNAPSAHEPEVLLTWSAASHHNHDRSTRWYWIGGVLVVGIAAYGILTGNWTLTLVSVLVGAAYFLVRNQETPLRQISLQRDGVDFDGNFTPWAQCKDFWIIKTPLFSELHITRNAKIRSEIVLQTADIDPLLIRSTLSQFLAMRVDQKERVLDYIIRICKL